jgi:hypothetical protein
MSNLRTRLARIGVASVAGTIAVVSLIGGHASAAQAADYTYPAAIDPSSIKITTAEGTDGVWLNDTVRMDASWSIPDGARSGETFGMVMPEELAFASEQNFTLTDTNDPAQAIAVCTVSDGTRQELTCTLTDYVEGKTGVSGRLWTSLTARKTTSSDSVTFSINGEDIPIPFKPIIDDYVAPTTYEKWAIQNSDDSIGWGVDVPGTKVAGKESITFVDTLHPADNGYADQRNVDGKYEVFSLDASLKNKQAVSGATGRWNADGTVLSLTIPGPFDPDRDYRVTYTTVPTAPAAGDRFGNTAVVSGIPVTADATWTASGGDGTGTGLGGFSVEKKIIGPAASAVPADTAFHVKYTIDGTDKSDVLALKADGSAVLAPKAPSGTTYTLEEVDTPTVDGVEWGQPTFSGEGVTDLGDGRARVTAQADTNVAVTLTNTASFVPVPVATGRFSVAKTVAGTGASLIAPDTVFTIEYSAGGAAPQRLAVRPDGTVSTSGQFDAGTVVTLREVDLPSTLNGSWSTPSFSGAGVHDAGDGSATLTIGADKTVAVAVTNTINAMVVPVPIPDSGAVVPTTPDAVPAGPSVSTGGHGVGDAAGVYLAAGALVLVGSTGLGFAAMGLVRSRRSRDARSS